MTDEGKSFVVASASRDASPGAGNPLPNQQKSLKFSMIPPLPSSKDKENNKRRRARNNDRQPSTILLGDGSSSNSKTTPVRTEVSASRSHSNHAPPLQPPTSSLERPHLQPFLGEQQLPRSYLPTPSSPFSSPSLLRDTSTSSSSCSPSSATTTTALQPRRVLRFGESMEALFCITSASSEEYRQLCRSIAHGNASEDAAAWRRALDMAVLSVTSNNGTLSDLVRLHRRATSRFSSHQQQQQQNNHDDVLTIWLSYAKVQLASGLYDEVRLTLQHVQNQPALGSERSARYYLTLSDLEAKCDNLQAAKDALWLGMQKKAEPLKQLQERYQQLGNNHPSPLQQQKRSLAQLQQAHDSRQSQSPNKRLKTDHNGVLKLPAIPPFKNRGGVSGAAVSMKDTFVSLTSDDQIENSNMSLVTEKTSTTSVTASAAAAATTRASSDLNNKTTNSNKEPFRVPLPPISRLESSVEGAAESKKVAAAASSSSSSSVVVPSVVQSVNKKATIELQEPKLNNAGQLTTLDGPIKKDPIALPVAKLTNSPSLSLLSTTLTASLSGTKTRPPLLSKSTGRLLRAGNLGLPQRGVDPNNNSSTHGDSSDSDGDESKNPHRSVTVEPHMQNVEEKKKKGPRKISRMDLSYMWEWDPTKAFDGKPQSGPNIGGEQDFRSPPTPERLEDEAPSLTIEGGSTGSQSATKELDKDKGENRTDASSVGGEEHDRNSKQQLEVTESSALLEKANIDFLPLVQETNMLRVNGVPYAKLGVVGKGGSCKVYRALSKECNVVAIKKVKLAGMEKKAIVGYANEIALLKRLRGNPAIIQMFDSEVDLGRKAIFVVMEVGEVDLNHVLQQQCLISSGSRKSGDSTSKRRNLNMNFIRLTWQQMLSAVHCIHEARIVHGDLKPANFLFVRGALKLIDFGIAKRIQGDDTTNIYREHQIGTLNYMSPEAIRDSGTGINCARMKIGRASDIWSLGCILYQMVYGKTPFAELHMIQKLQAIIDPKHKIQYPNGDWIDERAVDAMKQCLRRNANERPPIVGHGGLLNEHKFLHSQYHHPNHHQESL